ncbi:hypothetical protein CYMTET_11497 [Cymbomonas tetramitiformis]|uniref:DUF2428 domain-containing protein n=1 Tax=Cymbomonas tetramitiformis TaxID=36881 RepID=A0AAE0GMF5_9CHLO|nr:hypothetical protein CYMTET_11497 [Cymbomonas tetramitiformis]
MVVEVEPLEEASVRRLLSIVWSNLDDPLTQTVKQVQALFQVLADIQALQGMEGMTFLEGVMGDLLALPGRRKGKYLPLAMLVPRLGTCAVLARRPDLLEDMLESLKDETVGCAAAQLLGTLLEHLLVELRHFKDGTLAAATEGPAARKAAAVREVALKLGCAEQSSIDSWRAWWVGPVLRTLSCGDTRKLKNCAAYFLPLPLKQDGAGSLMALLSGLLELPATEEARSEEAGQGAALVALLKVARGLGIFQQLEERILIEGQEFALPRAWLEAALVHAEESVRLDSLELCCVALRQAALPGSLELHLVRGAIPYNMRVSSSSFRNKFVTLLRKMLARVRTATDRAGTVQRLQAKHTGSGGAQYGLLQGLDDAGSAAAASRDEAVACCEDFVRWLAQFMIGCLYPGAPFERKSIAIEVLLTITDTWAPPAVAATVVESKAPPAKTDRAINPYTAAILSPGAVQVLLGAVVDSWDRLREGACSLLMAYPVPLPGLEGAEAISALLRWAAALLRSPRVREADAAALLLRLLFRKYVLVSRRYRLHFHPKPRAELLPVAEGAGEAAATRAGPGAGGAEGGGKRHGEKFRSGAAAVERASAVKGAGVSGEAARACCTHLGGLCDLLEAHLDACAKDVIQAAADHGLGHGPLLAIRYALGEICFDNKEGDAARSEVRALLQRLLELVLRVSSVAMWALSDEGCRQINMRVSDVVALRDHDGKGLEVEEEEEEMNTLEEGDIGDQRLLAPRAQKVLSSCWLAMKEVGLVVSQIMRSVPNERDLGGAEGRSDGAASLAEGDLLDAEQLGRTGSTFLEALLAIKHSGALEKMRMGFSGLAQRLLNSSRDGLRQLPSEWLDRLLAHLHAPNQSLDDVTRRSAGIPGTFLALFMAEPSNCPKTILPRAMQALLQVAGGTAEGAAELGPVPRVHAFNCIRVVFNDTDLAVDTGFLCAQALEISIAGFGDTCWEVRNAAALAFGALLARMVGYMNVRVAAAARRSTTGSEFFHRYPPLHPFLLQQLRMATVQFQGKSGTAAAASATAQLHPSLHPPPSASTSAEAPQPFIGYNAVHGVLLQVGELLVENAPLLDPEAGRQEFQCSVATELMSCRWLASAAACRPAAVRAAFLEVCGALLQLGAPGAAPASAAPEAAPSPGAARELEAALGAVCGPELATVAPQPQCAGEAAWRRAAAMMHCKLVLAGRVEGTAGGEMAARRKVTEELLQVLQHREYEARKGALKVLCATAPGVVAARTSVAEFRRALVQRMHGEREYSCLRRVLQLLYVLPAAGDAWVASAPKWAEWQQLMELARSSPFARVQEEAVRCLGRTLPHLLLPASRDGAGGAVPVEAADALKAWGSLIDERSDPAMPTSSRSATVDALQAASGLLGAVPADSSEGPLGPLHEASLSAWLVALRLMEDDDPDIRCAAAHSASFALRGGEKEATAAEVREGSVPQVAPQQPTNPPQQEQRVLASSLPFLTRHFARALIYRQYLFKQIIGPEEQLAIAQHADMKLFDKEEDNQYAEPIYVSQLAAQELQGLLASPSGGTAVRDGELTAQAVEWHVQLCERLHEHLTQLEEMLPQCCWKGALTNHQEAFLRTYRLLLGLLSLVPISAVAPKETSERVVPLLERLVQLPSQPLVCNLLAKLLKVYSDFSSSAKTVTAEVVSVLGVELDAGFQPGFLLGAEYSL